MSLDDDVDDELPGELEDLAHRYAHDLVVRRAQDPVGLARTKVSRWFKDAMEQVKGDEFTATLRVRHRISNIVKTRKRYTSTDKPRSAADDVDDEL